VKRDQQIRAAAETLFFERSFDGVSVDEIGRAAGISGSAIYGYFSSKGEILSALFGQALDSLLRRLGEPDPDPWAELDKLARAFAELTVESEGLTAIWVREQRSLAQTYRREHDRRQRYITERWASCLQRCYPGHTSDEIMTATRGLQLLLMSEALRPPTGRRARDAVGMLVRMALASLAALDQPAAQAPANASNAASNASAASSIG
jgi:AcrR family transcriptional regulator